ncbi:methyl-accepting chemotaxis protein [Uliginosibacterium sp. 31-16]|uniref:methyl-accepting chemotaxis protein n=1 Tax=Uliginosibacterium sp. 31-16 TaxID=3068315 RepID=UPI00273FEC26|nr:methyl-accepting chemotaxis protein [Uliginosibacterium sp. 31-16]MDP5238438.1 methyl-accepting chemotaxis protein [Uliginosibacterium sp. 31-16]
MKIRTKLLLLLLVGGLTILGQGLCGLWQMQRLSSRLDAGLQATLASGELVMTVSQAQISFKTQVQEWKNILIRGSDKSLFDKHLKQFGEEAGKADAALARVVQGMQAAQLDPAPAQKAQAELKTLDQKYRAALQVFDPADPEAGRKVDVAVRGMDRSLALALDELEKTIRLFQETQATGYTTEAAAVMRNAVWLTVLGVVLVLVVMIWAGWMLAQSIMQSVSQLRQTVLDVEHDWDLTLRMPLHGRDELAQCGQALNQMLERFQLIVQEIHVKTETLAQQTGSIASALVQVSHAADAQSSSATEVAAAVEELTVSVGQVGEAAQEAQLLAGESRRNADTGQHAMEQGNAQLRRTSERINETAQALEELGTRSNAISGIVQTVKEIADQTNLLALNAAIEAARAGEQGRGFAVVADEVRKLAESTTRSTEQINELVKLIQESASRAIADVQGVVGEFSEQLVLAQQADGAIGQIRQAADQTSEASTRINDALREQSAASQLIARQVEQIAGMSEENKRAVSGVDQSTHSLNQLADELAGAVKRFRV